MQGEPIVLVVDDDSFIRALLQRTFGDAGIEVHAFASAADLLAHGDLDAACVLLLDVRMPDMTGPELHALLVRRGIRTPVIFLTGYSDVPVAVDAIRNGAVDFLVKPFDSETLVERVRETFVRHVSHPDNGAVSDHRRRLLTLTPREREVFDLMVTGMSSKHIARALACSFRTIDVHRGRVMMKMAASSLAHLVRLNGGPPVAPSHALRPQRG